MDFSVHVLEALARERLDDLRRQARVCALRRRAVARRRVRLRLAAAVVALGRGVGAVGAVLVAVGRRIGGDPVWAARP